MKTILFALALAIPTVLFTGCTEAPSSEAWQTVQPENGSFSVSMPGTPKPVSRTIPAPQGNIDVTGFQLEGDLAHYHAMYSTYPDGFLQEHAQDVYAFLERAVDATIQERNAEALDKTRGELSGYPRLDAELRFTVEEDGNDYTMRQMAILAEDVMYLTLTMRPTEVPQSLTNDVEKFHSSFQLHIEPAESKAVPE